MDGYTKGFVSAMGNELRGSGANDGPPGDDLHDSLFLDGEARYVFSRQQHEVFLFDVKTCKQLNYGVASVIDWLLPYFGDK